MTEDRKTRQREAGRRHYEKNKDRIKARARLHTQESAARTREYIQELKQSTPCSDCNINWPYYVMHFDHIGTGKSYNISAAMCGKYSLSSIQAEIQKCELVCANCHAIRTHQRANGVATPGLEPGTFPS